MIGKKDRREYFKAIVKRSYICKTNYFSAVNWELLYNGPFVFLSFQAGLDLLSVGHMLADVVAIIGKLSHQQNAIAIFSKKESLISLSCSLNFFWDVCLKDWEMPFQQN